MGLFNLRNYKSVGEKRIDLEMKKLNIKLEETKAKGVVPSTDAMKYRLFSLFLTWLGVLTLGLMTIASIKGNRTAIIAHIEKKEAYQLGIPDYLKDQEEQNKKIIDALAVIQADNNLMIFRMKGKPDSTKTNEKLDTNVTPTIKQSKYTDAVVTKKFRYYQSREDLVPLICGKCSSGDDLSKYVDFNYKDELMMKCPDCGTMKNIPINTIDNFVK